MRTPGKKMPQNHLGKIQVKFSKSKEDPSEVDLDSLGIPVKTGKSWGSPKEVLRKVREGPRKS